jgi:hypothetical protein
LTRNEKQQENVFLIFAHGQYYINRDNHTKSTRLGVNIGISVRLVVIGRKESERTTFSSFVVRAKSIIWKRVYKKKTPVTCILHFLSVYYYVSIKLQSDINRFFQGYNEEKRKV